MAEYTPLTSLSPDEEDFRTTKNNGQYSRRFPKFPTENQRTLLWLTIVIGAIAIAAAATFHISVLSTNPGTVPLYRPDELVSSLRMVQPSPYLEEGRKNIHKNNKKKIPKMTFPASMVRANAADPNKVYHSGSSIVLSSSDSMFYHWRVKGSWPTCYISGWVSPADKLGKAGKSYRVDGDVTAIEIWNVSSPVTKSLSWNTRPQRLSLMGTVNFTARDVQNRYRFLDGQELRDPTPRFDCSDETDVNIEISCASCRLEFEQIFSSPALGFEVLELA
ncbi:hypothetical protein SCP_0404750 [Sparassis crispa]|uniref:Uncharacterized protein n=1 Tax=Sparassis crispa TaxID=139825 RepID=A0A401GIT9_9APHY|nr:hypothetical protein SCP_0404750 [Sparassis crispa]GBE82096.1 hypothetical protein SCP_0404750 [Sparassis crispa]